MNSRGQTRIAGEKIEHRVQGLPFTFYDMENAFCYD